MSIERCPVCRRPTDPAHRPFCSRGCKDRDLLKWLNEGHRIPGPTGDPDLPDFGSDTGVDKADGAD